MQIALKCAGRCEAGIVTCLTLTEYIDILAGVYLAYYGQTDAQDGQKNLAGITLSNVYLSSDTTPCGQCRARNQTVSFEAQLRIGPRT